MQVNKLLEVALSWLLYIEFLPGSVTCQGQKLHRDGWISISYLSSEKRLRAAHLEISWINDKEKQGNGSAATLAELRTQARYWKKDTTENNYDIQNRGLVGRPLQQAADGISCLKYKQSEWEERSSDAAVKERQRRPRNCRRAINWTVNARFTCLISLVTRVFASLSWPCHKYSFATCPTRIHPK